MNHSLVLISLASAFCFAFALNLTHLGLKALPAMAGARISVPTTAVIFLAISVWTVDWHGWTTESAIIFAVAGLFHPITVTLLTFAANRVIGPNLTGALGNLTPIFAVVVAIFLLDETPTLLQAVGIGTVCAGVALLFSGRRQGGRALPLWAFALPILGALVRGFVQPLVKFGMLDWASPFAAVTIGYAVSALVILTLTGFGRTRMPLPTLNDLRWFVPIGIFNGAAVLLLYMALSQGPVAVVAPLVASYPLMTIVLSWPMIGARAVTLPMAAGTVITVIGVAVVLMG